MSVRARTVSSMPLPTKIRAEFCASSRRQRRQAQPGARTRRAHGGAGSKPAPPMTQLELVTAHLQVIDYRLDAVSRAGDFDGAALFSRRRYRAAERHDVVL